MLVRRPALRRLAFASVAGALVATGFVAVTPVAATGAGSEGSPTGPVQTTCAPGSFSLEPLAQAQRQASAMVRRMTLDQEVVLMTGVGSFKPPARTVGSTAPIPSLGIPALTQQDGPAGIGDAASGVTQLPAPEALAATFDPKAAGCYGQVIGTEARGKGVDLVYGPTVNIVRVPQWGRAFESLGEDPYLVGTIGGAEVAGLQRTGTMAQVKHYTVYNQETNRNTSSDDSILSGKTLQEIYLRAWDQILAAGPSSVMCSYATINGSGACQDGQLLDGYLDGTLHFSGFVGSDYYAVHSTTGSVDAGVDQEQPLPLYYGPALVAAVQNGQIPKRTVDAAAQRILTQMYRFRLLTRGTTGSMDHDVASAADGRVARSVAEEGTTLLKNMDHALPLSATGGGPVAVIGPAGEADPVSAGGGSATVVPPEVVSPLAGIRAAVGTKRASTYTPGLPAAADFTPVPPADLTVLPTTGGPAAQEATLVPPESGTYEFAFSEPVDYSPVTLSIDGTPLVVNPGTLPRTTYTATADLVAGRSYTVTGPVGQLTWVLPSQIESDISGAAAAARAASVAVVVVADGQESEGADRATLSLPADQDQLISAVAAANKHTVVVVDAGGPVLMPWLDQVAAVVDAWYPGQADGSALAGVLFGAVNPSGHLPITFPSSTAQDPVSTPAQFPGVGGQVDYSEGVDLGYRFYDTTGTTPLFPFGFGLSYTSFRYSSPSVHVSGERGRPIVTLTVRVANTGTRRGADVAQLYLSQPAGADEPPRQLEAFQRVTLDAGSSKTLTFTLRGLQLAHYDSSASAWRIAAGKYRAWLGDSSATAQLPVHADFRISRSTGLGT